MAIFRLEDAIFSKDYRKAVANLKKIIRQEARDKERMYDIRTSEGSGRKGSADMQSSLQKSGYSGGNPRKKSGSTDREKKKDRDTGTVTSDAGSV